MVTLCSVEFVVIEQAAFITESTPVKDARSVCLGGSLQVGPVAHELYGPSKILVGWATLHLAPPIIGLYVR